MVYDFHAHILPLIDDGAENAEMSFDMLKESKNQGVDAVIATPHCYPKSEKNIEKCLIRRKEAMELIPLDEGLPKIYSGFEVHLMGDLAEFSNIDKLCIENTRYMLLEMPTSKWTDATIENVYKLTLKGISPIIAHDERNMHQNAELRNSLYSLEVLIQINAASLFMSGYKKDIDRLMRLGMAHLIGTDMHNLTSRKPCMDNAKKRILKRYGAECWEYLMNNANRVISDEEITYRSLKSFKKKGIFHLTKTNI